MGLENDLYREVNIVKVGSTTYIPFGRLYEIIPEGNNVDAIFNKLESTLDVKETML